MVLTFLSKCLINYKLSNEKEQITFFSCGVFIISKNSISLLYPMSTVCELCPTVTASAGC